MPRGVWDRQKAKWDKMSFEELERELYFAMAFKIGYAWPGEMADGLEFETSHRACDIQKCIQLLETVNFKITRKRGVKRLKE